MLCGLLGSAYTPADSALRIGGRVDWPAVARLAAEHMVAGGLWSSAVANGLTIPEPYRAALAWEHRRNRLDASRRVGQVLDIVSCLNQAGIEPLLIKGAAQLLDGTFADPGERAMH